MRYYDDTGRHRGESIGRVDKMSKRQANKIRQQEFQDRTGFRLFPDLSLHKMIHKISGLNNLSKSV